MAEAKFDRELIIKEPTDRQKAEIAFFKNLADDKIK